MRRDCTVTPVLTRYSFLTLSGSGIVTAQQQVNAIPLMRYRLYQYVIAINHYKDEIFICENIIPGIESELPVVESLIKSKDVPVYPFRAVGAETSNMDNEAYVAMVKKGIASCHRGDVFQIVLSRRFQQPFTGDELNVYVHCAASILHLIFFLRLWRL